MAQAISAYLKTWKAQDGQIDPLITLYDIAISDAITLRLVSGNPSGTGSVSYNGNTYLASSIQREESEQTVEGELPSFRVAISNIDGIAGGYIEDYDLDGREVTITRVPFSTLSPSDALSETYIIQDPQYNREKAVVTLGHTNLFKRRLGWRSFIRGKCHWVYENRFADSGGCFYPSDSFSSDTRQNLRAGATTNGEQKRLFGWYSLNALKADIWDVDTTTPEQLYCESTSLEMDWREGVHEAPFLYRKITGDFDVYVQAEVADLRIGCMVGVLCQEDAAGFDSWVFLGKTQLVSFEEALRVASAQNAVADAVYVGNGLTKTYLRLKRAGNTFTSYWSDDGAAWTLIDTRTAVLDGNVRLGCCVSASNAEGGTIAGYFRELRFLAGGLATCARTLADCQAHGNVHRYGGFPGIPNR